MAVKSKLIYSLFNPFRVTCDGDVTYNPRRRVLGAIPVQGKITYHLYSFSTSKAGNAVNSSENRIGIPNAAVNGVLHNFHYRLIRHICI